MDIRDRDYYPAHSVKCDTARRTMEIATYADPDADTSEIFPASFIVCPVCDGKGTHVNPSIDSHGLSREDFDQDPDFAEDYRRGRFDVPCRACGGLRVILEPSTEAGKKALAEVLQAESESRAESEAERRMGA